MEATTIIRSDILDIIFDGKNKDYGAYDLRKTYNRRVVWALIITAGLTLLIFFSTLLANAFKQKHAGPIEVRDIDLSKAINDKPDEDVIKPEEKKIEKPKQTETVGYTKPVVVEDDKVNKDELPPDIDKVMDAQIGDKDIAGEKDKGIIAPPVDTKGTGIIETKKNDDNEIVTLVQIEAEFPGGSSAWRRYLEKNLDAGLPIENGAAPGIYTVVVKFVVSKDGAISNIQCENDPGYGLCEEAIRIIKKSPNWKPAMNNGYFVNAYRRQPVSFLVEEQP